MCTLHFDGVPERYREALRELYCNNQNELFRYGRGEASYNITMRMESGAGRLGFSVRGTETELFGSGFPQICRALGLFLLHGDVSEYSCAAQFSDIAIMFDCSRNGVITVQKFRELLRRCAWLGITQVYMYMEDTYEVPEYPYFGAYRGRYTREELASLNDYAALFDIELIPCIQTLAHLHSFLRWDSARELKDTEDILLAEDERVYAFVETLIRTVSAPFSTDKIHLGMDEAHGLGLGVYLKRHGYRPPFEILRAHLQKTAEICAKYNLRPSIWSDMFFRCVSPTGGYYDVTDADFSSFTVPENVSLVYWDYYHDDESFYERYLSMHKTLCKRIIFAGGTWIWNGFSPAYTKAMATLRAGIAACRRQRVPSVMLTAWGDYGCETPLETVLFPLVYAALCCYGDGDPDSDALDRWCAFFTGTDARALLLLDRFDCAPGVKPYADGADNPSKYLFYQDILLGLFDRQIAGLPLDEHYRKLCADVRAAAESVPHGCEMRTVFEFYALFAEFLAAKANIGNELRNAYHARDTAALESILRRIQRLSDLLPAVHEKRAALWSADYKMQGREVLDIKFGGLQARIQAAAARVSALLGGAIARVEELEEEPLLFMTDESDAEHRLCFCNKWHHIVSAGNIADI